MSPPLVRRLSVLDGVAIGVGSVIGVGIFRTTGEVLRAAGSPALAVAVWVAVGLVSVAGASAFGRVAARVPEAGGPYAYVREAMGARVAFVDGWFNAAVSIPARQAAQMAIIGEVIATAGGGSPRVMALGALAALYLIHLAGVRVGAGLQRVLTALKLALLATAVVAAVARAPIDVSTAGPGLARIPLSVGLAGAFYTYLGWHDVTHLAEELERPERSLPRVLVGTVVVVLVAYVAYVLALGAAFGGGDVARGDLPVRALARAVGGPRGEALVTWGILACMLGAAAEGVLVRPRLWFALARDGLAPRPLMRVDARGVPRAALTWQCVLMAALVASGSFAELLVVLSVAQAAVSCLEAASAFVLERRWGARVPWQSAVFFAANLALLAALARDAPSAVVTAGALVAVFAAAGTLVATRAGLAAERAR